MASWALAFGYAFSSLIQVLVPPEDNAKHLGRAGLKEPGLTMLLEPASSSCSFAALSAGRALLAKGAALTSMAAFLFGATKLSPQMPALAWIFPANAAGGSNSRCASSGVEKRSPNS